MQYHHQQQLLRRKAKAKAIARRAPANDRILATGILLLGALLLLGLSSGVLVP